MGPRNLASNKYSILWTPHSNPLQWYANEATWIGPAIVNVTTHLSVSQAPPHVSQSGNEIRVNLPGLVVGLFVSSLALFALTGCVFACWWKRKNKAFSQHSGSIEYTDNLARTAHNKEVLSNILGGVTGGNTCTIFTLKDLEDATNNFSSDNELGSGGSGIVYKGRLRSGEIVAIKRTRKSGLTDVEQFINEVSILSQVNHRNLVKLLGCCVDLEVPLLVYEFIPNGTVMDHLSRHQDADCRPCLTKLDWATRFRIAIQTAEALRYLHVQASPPIFHRDVKTTNILLDENYNAKVVDFGLSKLVDVEATHVSTMIKGTPGYFDPEYYLNFKITDKTDVYSFGVVLMELITSDRPVDMTRHDGDQNLAVRSIGFVRSGRIREIIDPNLTTDFSEEEFQMVEDAAQVAVACLVSDRASRPTMTEVLEMLQSIKGSNLKAEEFYLNERVHEIEMHAHSSSGKPKSSTSSSSGAFRSILNEGGVYDVSELLPR